MKYRDVMAAAVCLRNVRFKSPSVIKAAQALFSLQPHMNVVEESKRILLEKFNQGRVTFNTKDANFICFSEGLEVLSNQSVVVDIPTFELSEIDEVSTVDHVSLSILMVLKIVN